MTFHNNNTFYPWLNGWAHHNMFVSFQFGTQNRTGSSLSIQWKTECAKQCVLETGSLGFLLLIRASGFKPQRNSSASGSCSKTETQSNTHTHTHTLHWVGMIALAVCHYKCLGDHMFSMALHVNSLIISLRWHMHSETPRLIVNLQQQWRLKPSVG